MKKLLIVIDMQNDFLTGTLANQYANRVIDKVNEKISSLGKDDAVVATQDTHYPETYNESLEGLKIPSHCFIETPGWEIESSIYENLAKHNALIFQKNTFGYDAWDKEYLNLFDEIEICGVCTSICVLANATIIRTLVPNKKIVIDSQATSCISDETHEAALATLKSIQIEII